MANPTISDDGSVNYTSIGTAIYGFVSERRIIGDFIFEFAVDASNTKIPQKIGLYFLHSTVGYLPHVVAFGFQRTPGNTNSTIFALTSPSGTAAGATSVTFSAGANDRLSIIRTGDVVKFYKNYVNPMSEPINIATATQGEYKLGIEQDNNQNPAETVTASKCRIYVGPSYLYTVADQTTDFGAAQNPVKTRVYQVSAVVGRGDYTEANI